MPRRPAADCHRTLVQGLPLDAAEPLYRRAPRTDAESGKPLSDFMMFIPQLGRKPPRLVQEVIRRIERVLHQYADIVVFADLNLKINVLWVVVRPVPGACLDLPMAINAQVPEALLVAQPRLY
ncbi:MAG: hypothetical protein D6721_06235 [Gammaproteobacteria bacterium]|nr:MAG: hypothetical protein D6721_06235 [Gammaproteobacteria bacterium]